MNQFQKTPSILVPMKFINVRLKHFKTVLKSLKVFHTIHIKWLPLNDCEKNCDHCLKYLPNFSTKL